MGRSWGTAVEDVQHLNKHPLVLYGFDAIPNSSARRNLEPHVSDATALRPTALELGLAYSAAGLRIQLLGDRTHAVALKRFD